MTTSLKSGLIASIAFSLFVVIVIQTWYLADMRQQLVELRASSSTANGEEVDEPSLEECDAFSTMPDYDAAPDDMSDVMPDVMSDEMDDFLQPPPAVPDIPPIQDPGNPVDGSWFPQIDTHDWNPHAEVRRLRQHIDQMFGGQWRARSPDFDVRDEADRFIVRVNIPGADKASISVRLRGQRLVVAAEQRFENRRSDRSGNTVYQEKRSGKFRRSILLPAPVISRLLRSDYNNGVLVIAIPKA